MINLNKFCPTIVNYNRERNVLVVFEVYQKAKVNKWRQSRFLKGCEIRLSVQINFEPNKREEVVEQVGEHIYTTFKELIWSTVNTQILKS